MCGQQGIGWLCLYRHSESERILIRIPGPNASHHAIPKTFRADAAARDQEFSRLVAELSLLREFIANSSALHS